MTGINANSGKAHHGPVHRNDFVARASRHDHFDIVIIGGGIHGAAVARLAALEGFDVLLLERNDYAAGTSSRSSKMAHGGLRYLELLDFQQVFEGIKARERLFEEFAHLVRPEWFLIPVPPGSPFKRCKLSVGLWLYDLMVQNKEHKHRWIPRAELNFEGFDTHRAELAGCFSYSDGILNDTRLVLEYLAQARDFGAITLNYATVTGIEGASGTKATNHKLTIEWHDHLQERDYTSRASVVINCAGPWITEIAGASSAEPALRFSRGTHLLFNRPWTGPALFLPMEGRSRYYFVWPHFSGTMVGTTEREVETADRDPLPAADEIEEILDRLARDLPGTRLDRGTLHYCFAGVRTLPVRKRGASSAQLSRKHIWYQHGHVLTLAGGKLTTALWTAAEGLKRAKEIGSLEPRRARVEGEIMACADVQILVQRLCSMHQLSAASAQRLVGRLGRRALLMAERYDITKPLWRDALLAEVEYALDFEQAESVEDLMRRRLDFEYMPSGGISALPAVEEILQIKREAVSARREGQAYRQRMMEIHALLQESGDETANSHAAERSQ